MQPRSAEFDRRADHPPLERPDRRRDPELDPGASVPTEQVVDDNLLDCLNLLE